ncbi:MAG: glycosyltransferase family 4 protein [Phototrophicaceae bacterium]|jgi:glycosyltransferase involved in cell wall biosynthesis
MRLLMLNNEYPPIGGGTATANYNVMRELAAQGLHVDLVTSTPAGHDYEVETLTPTARVFRVPIANQNPHYQSERELLTYIYNAFFFIRTLYRGDEPKYDLCHAWSGLPAGALALLLKWKRNLPYIVGLRGSDVPGYDVRYTWLYPLLKPPLGMIWGGAAAITANSYELRGLARKFRPQLPIEVIPNGVDLARFQVTPLQDKTADDTFIILCVARLVERKGIADLIDAVAYIRQYQENFRLVFVGRGDKEAEFRAYVERAGLARWVEFRGAVMHFDVPAIYNEADVFVLPSLNEGMSNAVLEAMASGLPIITTYTGGTAEMLRGNGMVIPKQSPDAIAKAVIEVWQNVELRRTLGARSRAIAETLTWRRVADDYMALYDRTLTMLGVPNPITVLPQ